MAVATLQGMTNEEALSLVSAVERNSEYTIAQGNVRSAEATTVL